MPTHHITSAHKRPLQAGAFLLLSLNQWLFALAFGLSAAALFWPSYQDISPWLGVDLFLLGTIMVHFGCASRSIVPFPHLALLIVAVQYVLAAWISDRYPSHDPLCNIGYDLPVYLEYATMVFVACLIGWGVGLAKIRPSGAVEVRETPNLLMQLDILILIGFAGVAMGGRFSGTSLGFVFILLGNLRYLGVFGRMLCKGRGWTWRLLLVFVAEFLFATSGGMFGNLIIWGFWAVALGVFIFRPSWWKLAVAFACALVLLPTLHEAKWELRQRIWKENAGQENALEKSELFLSSLGSSLQKTLTGEMDEEFIGNAVARYNQGWIIHRVMLCVPKYEPHAHGETLKDALIATLLPRFIMPNKIISGGVRNMEKYAGVKLGEGTSMNLGYAGEMYANFGYWGGILGCGIYTLGFALFFRFICIRAFVSPLWWAVIPYVGFAALKAEDDVAGVVNWTSKACLVLAAVIFVLPAFRRALFPGRLLKNTC